VNGEKSGIFNDGSVPVILSFWEPVHFDFLINAEESEIQEDVCSRNRKNEQSPVKRRIRHGSAIIAGEHKTCRYHYEIYDNTRFVDLNTHDTFN
jgi:hypothetical protein